MSYSDRSSMGAAGGVGGVLIVIVLVGLRVGLKAAARASRNTDWSVSQADNSPQGPAVRTYNPETMSPITPEESQQQAEWLNQKLAEQRAERAERDQQNLEQMQQAHARRVEAAEQQQAEQARRADEYRAAEAQREADRQARLETDRQAREQAFAEAMANRNNPAPAAPPEEPAAPAQGAVDVVPGFAVTEIAQIKPRDKVFVQSEGQWNPALVRVKRGQMIQVRYTANGNIEAVTIDRVRLESEPLAKVASGLPNALRSVPTGPRATHSNEPEDDSLYVAKPKKDDEEVPANTPEPAIQPTETAAKSKAPTGLIRTWTNDTGAFKVEAELVGFEFGLVQLKKLDGKVATLPIDKLSPADQQIVRDKYK